MFESGVPLDANPELRAASDRAFAVLRAASERLIATLPAEGRPPALMMALHIWALSHGIASLFGRGDAARRALPMSPEDLMEAGVLVYLRGLGFPDPAGRRAPRRLSLTPASLPGDHLRGALLTISRFERTYVNVINIHTRGRHVLRERSRIPRTVLPGVPIRTGTARRAFIQPGSC